MSGLLTSNVFIDSSIYIKRNFSFNDHLLGQIARLSANNHIKLYISSIVINEVKNKIDDRTKETKSALESLRKKGMILRNIKQYDVVFNHETSNLISSLVKKQFDDFIDNSKVVIVPVQTVSVDKLLEGYFQMTPPFSNVKKTEFPDAINLLALDNWCNSNSEQMYVISVDNDLVNYCKGNVNLHCLDSIDSFLNLVTSSDEYRHNFVVNLAEKYFDNIEESISENFEGHGFSLENEDGSVESINVLSVELEDEINIIELEEASATLQFEVRVTFEAEVTYTDYANSVYDKEEGKYLLEKEVELEVETDVLIPVSIRVSFDSSNDRNFEVISCDLNEDRDISFMLYEEDYY
ncbi:PIN domain-containing protein [Paenibacillus profundus]|uniref:PIN domain-containing protein n=1 Tax=Paenibacillus profundus TaxID=1173085 RepID=A0ABS8YCX0_9BACL|nr:PIN domain-containing protein [Paenibacillus profundus]MCE5168355.1 PIN domain-containing protein [Paenibacillus profundus]